MDGWMDGWRGEQGCGKVNADLDLLELSRITMFAC